MKKKILVILCLLVLSGCNSQDKSKNLRCEKSDIVSENTVNEVITATFDDEEIKTADIKIETLIAEKYLPYIDTLEENMKNMYADYYDKQGITINMAMGNNSIILKINIDFDILGDDTKNLLGFSNIISTYGETKKEFEKSGYSCN